MPALEFNFDMNTKLKVATIVVSMFAIGLEADAYSTWPTRRNEEFYMAVIGISAILTGALAIGSGFGLIPASRLWKRIEVSYFGVMAALMLLSWILVVVSAADRTHYGWSFFSWYTQWQAETSFSLIFSVINIILYSYIAYMISGREEQE